MMPSLGQPRCGCRLLTHLGGAERMGPMTLSSKSFDNPDETVRLPKLVEQVVEIGGFVVGLETVDPGWRWSVDTAPEVGGEWCEAHHVGMTLSGRWGVLM